MKLVRLNDQASDQIESFMNFEQIKEKFGTITKFVNEAVIEKITNEKIKLYTPEFMSNLFKQHLETKNVVFYILEKPKPEDKALILEIADFLVGSQKVQVYEGNAGNICENLKKDNQNELIKEMCLVLDVPSEQKNSVINFLTSIDGCLKGHPKRKLIEIETKAKDFYGRLLVKYITKEEKNDKL